MREISEELGVHIRTVELMVNRVNKKMGWPISPLHSKHKNSEGFTRKPTKEKWDRIVKSKGFLSLREAVYEYSKKHVRNARFEYAKLLVKRIL
jgi:transposase